MREYIQKINFLTKNEFARGRRGFCKKMSKNANDRKKLDKDFTYG